MQKVQYIGDADIRVLSKDDLRQAETIFSDTEFEFKQTAFRKGTWVEVEDMVADALVNDDIFGAFERSEAASAGVEGDEETGPPSAPGEEQVIGEPLAARKAEAVASDDAPSGTGHAGIKSSAKSSARR